MNHAIDRSGHFSEYDTAAKLEIRNLTKERNWRITAALILLLVASYASGLCLISMGRVSFAVCGIVVTSQALILSWYLAHDCAHLLAFKDKKYNMLLGEALSCLNGTLYFSFKDYRRDHIRHHAEQVDLVGIDIAVQLRALPSVLRHVLLGLERIYVPSVYLYVKLRAVLSSVSLRNSHGRRATMGLLVYALVFSLLCARSWSALFCYIAAVGIRVHCVRFVDAFQHTYEHVDHKLRTAARGRSYEQRHTFSFPVARRYPFLNRFILNFGFHNAHHAVPSCPWYNLQALDDVLARGHETLEGAGGRTYERVTVGFIELVRAYHKNRIHRILSGNAGTAYGPNMKFSMAAFSGAFTDNLLG